MEYGITEAQRACVRLLIVDGWEWNDLLCCEDRSVFVHLMRDVPFKGGVVMVPRESMEVGEVVVCECGLVRVDVFHPCYCGRGGGMPEE